MDEKTSTIDRVYVDEYYLQPEKILSYLDYVLFFDTETSKRKLNIHEYSLDFKVGCYIFYDFYNHKEIERKVFYSKDEFINNLMRIVNQYYDITIISHNIDFDIKVLSLFDLLYKNNFSIKGMPFFDGLFYVIFRSKDKEKKQVKTIKILDSLNIFKDSLENLASCVGMKKIEIDYNDCSLNELERYCINDVEILVKIFIELLKFLRENNISFKISIAGISLSAYRNNFLKKISVTTPYEIREKERKAYKGGRVECFRIGDVYEKVYYVDVNSLYSFCSTFDLPYEYVKTEGCISENKLFEIMQKYYVIINADFEIFKNCIGVKRKVKEKCSVEKLIFPIGKIKGEYIHSSEINLIKQYGYIHKINEVLVYNQDKVLKDYVEYFYNLKTKSKGTSYYLFYKYLLNSLYGKFGQRMREVKIIKNLCFPDGYYNICGNDINDGYLVVYKGKGYLYLPSYNYAPFANVALAGAISAYGRCYLFNLMNIAGLENCYYCDTDGFVVNEKGFINLQQQNLIGDELGLLRCEKNGWISVYNCKWYKFNDKLKIKGVKNIDKEGLVTECKMISENDKVVEFTQEQVERFRTAIRKKRTDTQIVEVYTKKMSKEYDKGIVSENNNIKFVNPIILNEF